MEMIPLWWASGADARLMKGAAVTPARARARGNSSRVPTAKAGVSIEDVRIFAQKRVWLKYHKFEYFHFCLRRRQLSRH
jgi:hypothetical protein